MLTVYSKQFVVSATGFAINFFIPLCAGVHSVFMSTRVRCGYLEIRSKLLYEYEQRRWHRARRAHVLQNEMMRMGILLWIVFGALVGWIASMFMGSSGGLVWDIVVGIIGAVIGGWIMSLIGKSGVSGFNVYSFVVAIIGACVLIAIMRAVK